MMLSCIMMAVCVGSFAMSFLYSSVNACRYRNRAHDSVLYCEAITMMCRHVTVCRSAI